MEANQTEQSEAQGENSPLKDLDNLFDLNDRAEDCGVGRMVIEVNLSDGSWRMKTNMTFPDHLFMSHALTKVVGTLLVDMDKQRTAKIQEAAGVALAGTAPPDSAPAPQTVPDPAPVGAPDVRTSIAVVPPGVKLRDMVGDPPAPKNRRIN